jgi:hypothetical protein
MRGAGNLLHCLARQGDSHHQVLRTLLRIKPLHDLIDSTCLQEQTLGWFIKTFFCFLFLISFG